MEPHDNPDEVYSRYLPKWRRMVVKGETVTTDQAKEIIRRTDKFFVHGGGNNHKYNKWVSNSLGMFYSSYSLSFLTEEESKEKGFFRKEFDGMEAFKERWGYINSEYIRNSWISCGSLFGANGWCSPSGKISYNLNVGKWPSVGSIIKEWETVGKAFPFLSLQVTLVNDEIEIGHKVASLSLENGVVTVLSDDFSIEGVGYPFPIKMGFILSRDETSMPDEWIEEWGVMARPMVHDIRKEMGLSTSYESEKMANP